MKVIVFLFAVLFVATSPAFGKLTDEELQAMEGMMNTVLMPVMNELRIMKEELAAVKAEVAAVKTEVSELKAEVSELKAEVQGMNTELGKVKAEVNGLKEEVNGLRGEVGEAKGEVRGQGHRITDLRTFWVAGIGLMVTAIAFLYRKVSRLEMALALLQAENARLKSPIVTEGGAPIQTRKMPSES